MLKFLLWIKVISPPILDGVLLYDLFILKTFLHKSFSRQSAHVPSKVKSTFSKIGDNKYLNKQRTMNLNITHILQLRWHWTITYSWLLFACNANRLFIHFDCPVLVLREKFNCNGHNCECLSPYKNHKEMWKLLPRASTSAKLPSW